MNPWSTHTRTVRLHFPRTSTSTFHSTSTVHITTTVPPGTSIEYSTAEGIHHPSTTVRVLHTYKYDAYKSLEVEQKRTKYQNKRYEYCTNTNAMWLLPVPENLYSRQFRVPDMGHTASSALSLFILVCIIVSDRALLLVGAGSMSGTRTVTVGVDPRRSNVFTRPVLPKPMYKSHFV